jgi:hypothetical protein
MSADHVPHGWPICLVRDGESSSSEGNKNSQVVTKSEFVSKELGIRVNFNVDR